MKFLVLFSILAIVLTSYFVEAAEDSAKPATPPKNEVSVKEEANDAVGPEKGILEADALSGIKLAPEALKNFGIESVKLANSPSWSLPAACVVRSGNEINLFRLRDGFYKRIDLANIKKNGNQIVVASPDLRPGDQVVVKGLGFLRIAELSAFGGLDEGH